MVATKKRITTELLHIALVITLLRGNPRQIGLYDNVISSNFFNDVNDIDNILIEGPNWAFTRTNYHRMYLDPGLEPYKSLSGDFSPYDNDDSEDFDLDEDPNFDEAVYRQQARLLLLSQLNAAYVSKDPARTLRDITAYLVSDATTEILPNSLAGLPIVPPISSSGSGSTELPGPSPASSPDSGHEDSGDESRTSTSESDLTDANTDELTIGGLSDFEETEAEKSLSPQLNAEALISSDNLLADLNSNLDINNIDTDEFIDFIRNNNAESEVRGAVADPSSGLAQSSSFPTGLQGNDYQSLVSDLFELDQFDNDATIAENMAWTLAEEEAHLDFYKDFNEVANSELLRTVPMKVVEGGIQEESNDENQSQPLEDGTVPSVPDTDETVLGATANFQNVPVSDRNGAEETESIGATGLLNEEEVSALLDEFLDTDSGFDFLGSPTLPQETVDFENPSPSNPIEVDAESNREVEQFSLVDMIQAASIHANARPTTHAAQPRGFQVHARMPGLLRGGGSMDQRWQELASILSLSQGPHDGTGGPLPPSITHPFGPHPHHHHHLHHAPPSLHHHSMHHPPFSSAGPPSAPYNPDSARSVLLQNATLPPSDLNSTSPYSSIMGPPPNLGSAVASSMHLTNSSDSMIDPSSHYKMIEPSHDMIYYPNASNAEMNNQTTEGFLSSILNDDDLQLMDMAMNEGMYTMRMLDNGVGGSNSISLGAAAAIANGPQPNLPHGAPNGCPTIGAGAMTNAEDRMEASSDSAVSSMGSERVPPMTDPAVSDNEWVDPDSHPQSSHDSSPYSLDYSGGKLRGYDYYGKDRIGAPVAQKKHQMFGKRFQQEHGSHSYGLPPHPSSGLPYQTGSGLHSSSSLDLDMKYGCSLEFARHHNDVRGAGILGQDQIHSNHTYALPPTHPDNPLTSFRAPRPPTKDKAKMNEDLDRFVDESLSRDEKRARAMNLPITTEDIINLPMDEFNERLSKYDLSEPQLSLIRDIRRRGKNKVAAQNCRKRKLDQIVQLADEVQRIRERKQSLIRERNELSGRRLDLQERYKSLYRHVFQALRDPEGNPYSSYEYSLQQAADGNIVMVPRNTSQPSASSSDTRRDKSKDDYNKKGE